MLGRLKRFLQQNTAYGKSRYLNYLYRYDMQRYLKYSCKGRSDAASIAARIRLLAHALEKGLSVADGRKDFGREKAQELLALMDAYRKTDMPDEQVLPLAESLIASYREFRVENGVDISFLPEYEHSLPAGAMEYVPKALPEFEKIAFARHSVRSFGKGQVDAEKLYQAVALAQTAPSACNRQASRVYACLDNTKIAAIIARHGGMRGFNNVGCILALTGDLTLYTNEYERNTVFVDGGIFLMNLLYGLQSVGLAACPIIWGAEPDNDGFLSKLLNIPQAEEIVALVMVGKQPEEPVRIPCSAKRETKTILHLVDC